MGQPITWRNIDSPRIDDISRAFTSAQVGVNAGFHNIADVLKQQEATNTANWDQTKQNNTQAFLDEVGKYRTPEEYQAALASGAIDQARQQYGAQIDARAARSAQEANLATLQQRARTALDYTNLMQEEKYKPARDAYTVAALKGDSATMDQIQQANPGMPFAALLEKGQTIARGKVEQGYADSKQTWAGNEEQRKADEAPIRLDGLKADNKLKGKQSDYYDSQTSHTNALADKERAEAASTGPNTKRIEGALAEVTKSGTGSAGYLGTKEGDTALQEFVLKHADKGDIPTINAELSKLMRTGIKDKEGNALPIPVTYAINAIMGMGSSGWLPRFGNQVSDKLSADILANKDTVVQDYAAINQLRRALIDKGTPRSTNRPNLPAPTADSNAPVSFPKGKEMSDAEVSAAINNSPEYALLPTTSSGKRDDTPAPQTTEATRIADARKKLTSAFTTTQAEIRKSGGLDNITELQRKELQRISQGMSELDTQEASSKDMLTKVLSERRRLADQEAARKEQGRSR